MRPRHLLLALQLPAIATSMGIGWLIDRFQPRTMSAIDNLLRARHRDGARTLLPELVEDRDLDAANMLWSFSANLSLVLGPAVGGVLVAGFGGPSVLLVDAGSLEPVPLC